MLKDVVVNLSGRVDLPGGAANAATNVRRLGAKVSFLSVVGDDREGVLLRELLGGQGVATSYLVARLAPGRPMRHALVFGLVGVVIGTAGMVATWGRGPEFGPKWYALAVIAMALPCAWAGGRLFDLQMRGRLRQT